MFSTLGDSSPLANAIVRDSWDVYCQWIPKTCDSFLGQDWFLLRSVLNIFYVSICRIWGVFFFSDLFVFGIWFNGCLIFLLSVSIMGGVS